MAEERKTIVVGGGIGGLTASIALRRNGLDCVVLEAGDVRKLLVGGGIHMWANAMRALERAGVAHRVSEAGAPIDRTEYRTFHGRLLAEWPLDEIGRDVGTVDVGISRRDLLTTLVDAADDDTVRSGARCVGFEQDANGVTARLESGEEVRGSVLVGADGLRSTIRQRLHGDEPPRYAGYAQWQAIVERGDLLPAGVERVVFGRGSRAVLHHVGGNRLFWAAAIYGPEGSSNPAGGRKPVLETRFRGFEPPILEAVAATAEEEIVGFDIYDRPPLESWGEGRVTLLGDAAHAMTTNLSQGGCQALEDAVVLARVLRDADDEVEALRAYEVVRIARTTPIVKRSHMIARVGAFKNPVVAGIRDRALGFALGGAALREHRTFVAVEL